MIDSKREKFLSKFFSYVLRHHPKVIDLKVDEFGWASVDELMANAAKDGKPFTMEELQFVVANNAKQRFSLSEDNSKIRANQGHSFPVNLELEPIAPPAYLYHGTVAKFIEQIKEDGLQKMSRQHVHLSPDRETAINVGSRRGKPVILTIRAGAMHESGYQFYLSKNGVWLVDAVPAEYIEFK
ncbi:RNA 2'-phosphotransferase [Chondrinema litorale]|uniref:RNA 2'-phosphotransferase n=1 Tax=Chondrinema litorale TaxID=2994555 RepID=UPI0025448527|nr:RNA 2'-phosphotransferase [Chondrinema litorale]UZR94317.1 RNA 2'-phosphotransferase [Chondrinema litorale]